MKITGEMFDALDGFVLKTSKDDAKRELELMCEKCGERICDAEPDDSIRVLAMTALAHTPHCEGE